MVKKIANIVISTLTAIIFTLTIIILIFGTITIKQGKMIKIFGYSYSVVATDSMTGTIEVGDMILIKYEPFEEIVKQDIIVFKGKVNGKDANIVHRVVDISTDGLQFTTKGDNPRASTDETPVSKDNYIGKVVKYGDVGIGNIILHYRNYVFGAIVLIFVFVIVSQIISILKTKQEKEKLELEESKNQELEIEREKMKAELLEEMKKEKK